MLVWKERRKEGRKDTNGTEDGKDRNSNEKSHAIFKKRRKK